MMKKRMWMGLALIGTVSVMVGWSSCLVAPLQMEDLLCGRNGECSSGMKCYATLSGNKCFSDGAGREPAVFPEPISDAGATDTARPDKRSPDTGTPDSGTPDPGTPDTGSTDTGVESTPESTSESNNDTVAD